MSLNPQTVDPIPEQTVQVARVAFPKGNIYMRMRDELGAIFSDEQFAQLFARRGQPAYSLWRLALVCVMQYVENLSDRQAAEAVRARIDWKYALSLVRILRTIKVIQRIDTQNELCFHLHLVRLFLIDKEPLAGV